MAGVLFASHAFGDEVADQRWAGVEQAMETVKKLMATPGDELRSALLSYDALGQRFLKDYPRDARRWKVLFFDGVTWESRRKVQLPTERDQISIMNEILQASDADPETLSGASAVRVLAAHRDLDAGGDAQAWIRMAEQHLKDFPVHPADERIRASLEQVKSWLHFRDRPIDLKFVASDRRTVELAALRGKVVLIDFWESTCPVCAADMPGVADIYAKLHDRGFEIIGICLDKDEFEMRKFMEANQMTWPEYHDGKQWDGALPKALGVHYTPTMWLVDKSGHLVTTNARGKLEQLVLALLAK
jgi:peroxiredoxin